MFRRLASDPVPVVRIAALRGSRGISRSARRTAPTLHLALNDSSAEVRAQAIYMLAAYGDDASLSIPHFIARLSDSVAVVRSALQAVGLP